jgi:hypothetical protein
MNMKRWLYASAAAFVVLAVLEFVVNGVLLAGIYQQTASVWRPEAEMVSLSWLFWLAYLVFAPVFTLIYSQGFESNKEGIGQGLRFGIYVGLLTAIPMNLIWYVVLPIPASLAVYWAIAGMVEMTAMGLTVGLIYKK